MGLYIYSIYDNITITVRPWRHAKPFRVCWSLAYTGNVWLMSWIKATWWASNDRIRFGGRCSLLWCNNNNNWAPRLWWACSQVVGVYTYVFFFFLVLLLTSSRFSYFYFFLDSPSILFPSAISFVLMATLNPSSSPSDFKPADTLSLSGRV